MRFVKSKFPVLFYVLAVCMVLVSATIHAQPEDEKPPLGDFGDAPENNAPVGYEFANPEAEARFPSGIFDEIFGTETFFIRHREPEEKVFLGKTVTEENDAILVDSDLDDGWTPGSFSPCAITQLNVDVTVPDRNEGPVAIYLNLLFDWDHNAAWEGASNCPGATQLTTRKAVEWPIQNLALHKEPYILEPGFQGTITLPAFLAGPEEGEMWMRITITTEPIDTENFLSVARGGMGWTGEGDFEFGETEDYFMCLLGQSQLSHCPNILPKFDPDPFKRVGQATNNLPIAFNQNHLIGVDTTLSLTLTGQDPDNDPLTYSIVNGPLNGSLVGSGPNQTYIPNPGFTGSETIVFQVEDEHGGIAFGVIIINVSDTPPGPEPVNSSALEAKDQTLFIPSNTPVDIEVETESSETNPFLLFSIVDAPKNGTVSGNGPDYRYVPEPGFSGTDTFVYQVQDQNGNVSLATVTIVIQNSPPEANDQSHTIDEDTNLPLTLTGSDPEDDPLTCTLNTEPQHGTVIVNEDCSAEYVPDPDYNGTDFFEFTMTDPFGASDIGRVDILINPVNDPPVANDDTVNLTDEDLPVDLTVVGNDFDIDGDDLTITGIQDLPDHGTVTINADNTITYDPDPNFNGNDSFVYILCDPDNECDTATVNISINAINDPPTPDDESETTNEDTPITIDVLDGDTDVDGLIVPGSVKIVSGEGPSSGTITNIDNVTGQITYEPNLNFHGTDTFKYEVCDDGKDAGNSAPPGILCAEATVTIIIDPVNDAPVLTTIPDQTINEDDTLTVNLSCTDVDTPVDGDSLTLEVFNAPAGAVLTDNGDGTGQIVYTPDFDVVDHPNFQALFNNVNVVCKDDSLGNLSDNDPFRITVIDVNRPPVAIDDEDSTDEDNPVSFNVLNDNGNGVDSDPDNDTLTVVSFDDTGVLGTVTNNGGGNFTYDPGSAFQDLAVGEIAQETFTYTIEDGFGGSDTATVTITIIGVNDAPDARDDVDTTPEDTPVTTPVVIPNDTDPDGDFLAITVWTQPSNGSVSCTGTQCTYTPDAHFNGVDTYTYTISDGHGGFDTATVTITVDPANDVPMADPDLHSMRKNTAGDPQNLTGIALPVSDPQDTGATLTCSLDGPQPANGTVTVNSDCTFDYTPTQDFIGTNTFDYEVCDDGTDAGSATPEGILCATNTITIQVNNDPPTADPQSRTTFEDTLINLTLTGSDPNSDPLIYEIIDDVDNGTLICTVLPDCTYTPNNHYNGTDQFTFKVTDPDGEIDTAIVDITITPINDPPVALDDSFIIDEDISLPLVLMTSDLDIEFVTDLVHTITDDVDNGTLDCTSAPSCVYTPDLNFHGTDQFTYQVCDDGEDNGTPAVPGVLCDTAVIDITIDPVNDDPILTPIPNKVIDENSLLTVNLTCTDVDTATVGDSLTIDVQDLPPGANFVDNTDGTGVITFTPLFTEIIHPGINEVFSGVDVTCTDNGVGGLSDTDAFNITVNDVNRQPNATDNNDSTDEDTPVTITVLADDSDPDAEDVANLEVTAASDPANGTVSINVDGTIDYTPDTDFNGVDTFTYTICDNYAANELCDTATVTVTVNPINDPPTAKNNNGAKTPEDTPKTVNVLGNDNDNKDIGGDLDPATVTVLTPPDPSEGTVSVNLADGKITFTPAQDFTGVVNMTYEVCDNALDNGFDVSPSLCDTANLRVTVNAVNDAPVLAFIPDQEEDEGDTLGFTALCTDVDGDSLSFDVTNLPFGVSFVDNGNGSGTFSYTPSFNLINHAINPAPDEIFNGINVVCSDGQVQDSQDFSITVHDKDRAPTANPQALATLEDISIPLTLSGSDLDSDTLTFSIDTPPANGTVNCPAMPNCTYFPDPDYNGTDQFTFQVDDGFGKQTTAVVDINITSQPDPPVAINDGVIDVTEDDPPLVIDVLVNDSDPDTPFDGDVVTVDSFTQPSKGIVNCDPNGCTYTLNSNKTGTDSYTYTITDGTGRFDTATVTFNITAVNDPPTASNVNETVEQNHFNPTPVVTNLPVGDADLSNEGDVLTCTIVSGPTDGSLNQNGCNTVTYTHDVGFVGTDSYDYEVCDQFSVCLTRTVTIEVTNTPPVANNITLETLEDLSVPMELSSFDVNGDPVTYTITTAPANGTLDCSSMPNCSYLPDTNFTGSDSFVFEVDDGDGGTDSATVNITVNPVNDPPVANDMFVNVTEDNSKVIVLDVSDPENDSLTCNPVVANPAHGTTVFDPGTCTVTYTPDTNYSGIDRFGYTVTDGNGSDQAVVNILVGDVNDPPVLTTIVDQIVPENTTLALIITCDDLENPNPVITVNNLPPGANFVDGGNGSGSLTYSPDFDVVAHPPAAPAPDEVFTADVTCDDQFGEVVMQSFDITVTDVNRGPSADDQSAFTPADTLLNLVLTGSDPDTDALTCSLNTQASDGVATVNSDCTATYMPDPGFNGDDSFTFLVDDGFGGTAVGTVTLEIESLGGSMPLPLTPNQSTPKNVAIGFTLTAIGGSNFSIITTTGNGTLDCSANPNCTYTPNPDFVGVDSFIYEVCNASFCAQDTVNITVFNSTPNAKNDSDNVNEDTDLDIFPLGNDSDPDGDGVSIDSFDAVSAQGGMVTLLGNKLTYSPALNFNGVDSFTYTICDDDLVDLKCDTATITIVVIAVDDAPVLTVVSNQTVVEENNLTVPVTCTDVDTDPALLLLDSTNTPGFGLFVDAGNGAGAFFYQPTFNTLAHPTTTSDFTGIELTCSDGVNTVNNTHTVTVNDLNRDPIPNNQTLEVDEDTGIPIVLSANDFDLDSVSLALTGVAPTGLDCTNIPNCTYNPPANFNGPVSFDFEVTDGFGGSAIGTIDITVNPVNDPPVADPQTLGPIDEDSLTPLAITLTGSDVDLDTLTFSIVSTSGLKGTLTCTVLPDCEYLPDVQDFNGNTSFTFQVDDGNGETDTAVVTIQVDPVNDPPNADDISASTLQDTNVILILPVSDVDISREGDTLTCSEGTPGEQHGTLVFNGCQLTYTPDFDFVGQDVFNYDVCDLAGSCDTAQITIDVLNRNPVAFGQTVFVAEDNVLPLTLSGNDPDGDPLTCTSDTDTTNGVLVVNANCTATYTPDLNYNGGDSFVFQVDDGHGGLATAGVTITVTPVNDPPAMTAIIDQTIAENNLLSFVTTCTDVDTLSANLTVTAANLPHGANFNANGNGTGTLTYTPTFSVVQRPGLSVNFPSNQVSCDDGEFTDVAGFEITVNDTNQPPTVVGDDYATDEDTLLTVDAATGLLNNDSDNDGDSLTVTSFDALSVQGGAVNVAGDGSFTFVPTLNTNGADSFTYTVSDGFGGVVVGTVNLTVNAINDDPDAVDDPNEATDEDNNLLISVLPNDSDIDLDTLSISAVGVPDNGGSATINGTQILFDPGLDFQDLDVGEMRSTSFTYDVSDGNGGTDTATVTVEVSGLNDTPLAQNDPSESTDEDTIALLSVLDNDSDVDTNDSLSLDAVGVPDNGGSASINGNQIEFDPGVDFNDLAVGEFRATTFTYDVTDSTETVTASVTVTVSGVNDDPTALDDPSETTDENSIVFIDVDFNDTDPDTNDSLTIISVGTPDNGGTASISGNQIEFDPDVEFDDLAFGESRFTSFTYDIEDGNGGTSTATVTVMVTGLNDAPVAMPDDVLGVNEDDVSFVILSDDLLFNDIDVDNLAILTFVSVDAPDQGGTLIDNLDGTFSYTPPASFQTLAVGETGIESFDYTIEDEFGEQSISTVTLFVDGANDDPIASVNTGIADEDNITLISIILGAEDIDLSDVVSIGSVGVTDNGGTVSIVGDQVQFDPGADFDHLAFGESAITSFTYTLQDDKGGASNIVLLMVTVNGVNDDPTALDDTASVDTSSETDVIITVLTNDSDPDLSDILSVIGASAPTNGSVVVNGDNTITYTPDGGFIGQDTFTYTISDGQGGTSIATVTINVS